MEDKQFEINETLARWAIREFKSTTRRMNRMFETIGVQAWDLYGCSGEPPEEYVRKVMAYFTKTADVMKDNYIECLVWLEKTYGKGAESGNDSTPKD